MILSRNLILLPICGELMVCMQGDKAKSAAEDVKKQAKDATN